MSEATEALSAVDAIASGRFDRFLLSLHLAVQDRMNVLGKTVREDMRWRSSRSERRPATDVGRGHAGH